MVWRTVIERPLTIEGVSFCSTGQSIKTFFPVHQSVHEVVHHVPRALHRHALDTVDCEGGLSDLSSGIDRDGTVGRERREPYPECAVSHDRYVVVYVQLSELSGSLLLHELVQLLRYAFREVVLQVVTRASFRLYDLLRVTISPSG